MHKCMTIDQHGIFIVPGLVPDQGMVFYRPHVYIYVYIAKSAELMLGPFMAGCHNINQFARYHYLMAQAACSPLLG